MTSVYLKWKSNPRYFSYCPCLYQLDYHEDWDEFLYLCPLEPPTSSLRCDQGKNPEVCFAIAPPHE